jgi:hypothetical protein
MAAWALPPDILIATPITTGWFITGLYACNRDQNQSDVNPQDFDTSICNSY